MTSFIPRSDPAHPRPADHVAAHQDGDAARLGLVGRRRSTPSPPSVRAQAARHRPRRRHARRACRCRAAARSRSRRRSTRSCRATATCWCSINGAYGKRLAKLAHADGPRARRSFDTPRTCRSPPTTSTARSRADPSITHVGAHPLRDRRPASSIRCRRSPRSCARHGKGLIVDAMSSFGALPIDARDDAVRRAGRGLGQVRRGRRRAWASSSSAQACSSSARATRTRWRWTCTTSGRYMEKTDAVALHAADARRRRARRGARPVRRGGRPAGAARALRAQLRDAGRRHGGARLPAVPRPGDPGADHRHVPRAGRSRATTSSAFYDARARHAASSSIRASSPQVETFRVGCIGAIGPDEMRQAVNAVRDTLAEMGIRQVAPAARARAPRPDAAARTSGVARQPREAPRARRSRAHRPRSRRGAAGSRASRGSHRRSPRRPARRSRSCAPRRRSRRSRCSTASPSWFAGAKSAGSTRSCTKIVSCCRPSGCARQMCTAPRGCARRREIARRCRLPPTLP